MFRLHAKVFVMNMHEHAMLFIIPGFYSESPQEENKGERD